MDLITYAIAKDSMPFTTVEKPGFTRMLKVFDHCYEPPSRKYFSKTAVPRLYNITKEKVELELKSIKFFSSTTDLWSSETLHPYTSFTVHFITNDWDMKSFCLQTAFLPDDHTGDTLAEALEATLDGWKLDKEQQVCITTDSGAKIVCAINKLEWQRLSYFWPNLNLAVTKAVKDDHCITIAIWTSKKNCECIFS